MTTRKRKSKTVNILLKMHPVERVLVSLGMSGLAFLVIRTMQLQWVLKVTVLWDAFALSFILISWIVFFTRSVEEIIQQANKDDGSRVFVMVSILASAFASMFTVLFLMIAKEQPPGMEMITVLLSVLGMMSSWMMVHTIFTFHYAHLYYDKDKDDTPDKTALDFPQEKNPDYIDFAYFAFVIGMTFQVSDVEISSRRIRRTALAHGLLAFALNTFVVALTINIVAGLRK